MESSLKQSTISDTIKQNYQFSHQDALVIKDLLSLMRNNSDDFMNEFYKFIYNFEHAKAFLKNDDIIKLHNVKMKNWFIELFSGNYEADYFCGLENISEAHSRIGLPTHYINASFNFVRRFILRTLISHNKLENLDVIEKLVDINLDVLTSSYLLEDTKRMVKTIKIIKKALDTSSLVLFYQPIVENISQSIVKYECLVRLIDDTGNIVSPVEFLPVAKEIKLYNDITKEVIKEAFSNFHLLNAPFSINLSVDDIENDEVTSLIFKLLTENKAIGNHLTFEILESEEISDYKIVSDFIMQVKEFGVRVAIDDFGSGFSNFDLVTKLDVDYLKIDGSLIKNIHNDKECFMAVESIVELSSKLGIETIGEFVGSQEVFQAVKKAGVNYSQGFYFGKPGPVKNNHIKKSP